VCRDEHLWDGRRLFVREPIRHPRHVARVNDDAVGEPAPAHEPEDAVAFRELANRGSGDDDSARDLEPGDVLWGSRRRRIRARELREICRVDGGEAHRDEQVVASRRWIGTLLEAHHLAATRPGVDDRPHVESLSDERSLTLR
jgi:hypothetical protein